MYSTIKIYKNKYIIVYYCKESIMRFRTGLTVPSKKDFDEKKMKVRSYIKGADEINELIKIKHENIEKIIIDSIKGGIEPTGNELKKIINKKRNDLAIKKTSTIEDLFKPFLEKKTNEFKNSEKSITSIKDYKSFFNAFLDYQIDNKTQYQLEDITLDWIEDFVTYLRDKRNVDSETYQYKTKGNLGAKTIHKRIGVLKSFFKYVEKKIGLLNEDVKNYKVGNISERIMTTLTLEEIALLKNHNFQNSNHQKAIDLFLFTCQTGLRISDLYSLKKKNIIKENNGFVLRKMSQKTKSGFGVPLTTHCCSVLEKYEYNFKLMAQVNLRLYLKEALQMTGYFNDYTDRKKKGSDIYFKRWEYLTYHDGRRTFITNLVNNSTPLNQICQYTGHKKLSTLQKYVNFSAPLDFKYIKIFEK